jgi:hypothetical protein
MSDYQIVLLPKTDYYAWLNAAKDYAIKFGVNLTSDPDSAGRYMTPQQVITIAGQPEGYPGQGDIVAWFSKNYPSIKIDLVPAKTPAEFQAALAIRIKANNRYAPVVTSDFKRLWPAGVCLVGLHGRADGGMQDADIQVVSSARVEAVKLMLQSGPEHVSRLKAINPNVFLMVRLFARLNERPATPDEFVSWNTYDMDKLYRSGVRYFEIHNEPNLKAEGWTVSWQNGREFGAWWLAVRHKLKALFPEAKFGWPGLSPDGFPMPERINDLRFLEEGLEAVRAADWIGLHCYWRDENEMRSPNGGMGYLEYRKRFPDKLLFITEFSNPTPNTDLVAKGTQYVKYYQMLRNTPGIGAAFAFIVSASANFPHEAWRGEDHRLSEIVDIVGRRTV